MRTKRRNSSCRCRGKHWPITQPSRTFRAANNVVVPDIQNCGRTYAQRLGQSAATPVSLPTELAVKSPIDNLGLFLASQRLSATRTRRVSKQPIRARPRESRKPQIDCRTARRKAPGYGRLRHSVCKAQDNPGVQHDLLGTSPSPNKPLKKAALIFRNGEWQACRAHTTCCHKTVYA